eukprot:gene12286-3614_t
MVPPKIPTFPTQQGRKPKGHLYVPDTPQDPLSSSVLSHLNRALQTLQGHEGDRTPCGAIGAQFFEAAPSPQISPVAAVPPPQVPERKPSQTTNKMNQKLKNQTTKKSSGSVRTSPFQNQPTRHAVNPSARSSVPPSAQAIPNSYTQQAGFTINSPVPSKHSPPHGGSAQAPRGIITMTEPN